jgi:hypothetical protein
MPANTTLGLLLEAKTTGQQDLDKLTDALNKFTGAAENSAKRTEDANKKASDSTRQYADLIKTALSEPIASAGVQLDKFAVSLGKPGAIAAGVVAGIAAIGVGAFELTKHYAEAAKQTINFSERLGITITQAQKLGAQAKLSGVDIGVLESSTRILATALEDSQGSGAKAYKALLQLGVASRTSRSRPPRSWLSYKSSAPMKTKSSPAACSMPSPARVPGNSSAGFCTTRERQYSRTDPNHPWQTLG